MMEIKEVISKSLFVIGAGFSKPAGCKMSSEMLDDLRIHIQKNDEKNRFNNIEKEALKFLLSSLSYHAEWRSIQSGGKFKFKQNIEELILLIRRIRDRENYLPYVVTGNWADKLVQLETAFNSTVKENEYENNNLFSSIELKIKKDLLKGWLKFEESKFSYLEPLREFIENYPNENFCLNICSFNYDLILEKYFSEVCPWMGFSNGKWVGLESAPSEKDEKRRINLYKLHGSLNWIRNTAGDIWEKEKWQNKKKEANIDEQEEQYLENDPFIIFGQGVKTFSIEPFFSQIHHFKKLLKEKDYIFVIGYSFFDPYINNLLITATLSTSKKIIIVNPEFGPKENFSKSKSKDCNSKFGECYYPEYQKKIAEYIEEIQKNSFYSELPEFNISYVKPDSLFYIQLKAEEFIKKYFSNKGNILRKLIEQFEQGRKEVEKPFE
ncbi:MAG TPA: SIR2 family protein [Candidatus Paceibacterota bacterium]|nr:SIR2 family protein [Candidatus Paceibacterota bacterium]